MQKELKERRQLKEIKDDAISYGEKNKLEAEDVAYFMTLIDEAHNNSFDEGYREAMGSAQSLSSDEAWSVGWQAYKEGFRDGKYR